MDTVKSFKGYGKVNDEEDRVFYRKNRRRLLLTAGAVVLLIIIIAAITAVVASEHRESPSSSSTSPPVASTSIKAVCAITRYPDSCYSSISSVGGSGAITDPEEIFKIALKVAMDAVASLSSLPDTVNITATGDERLRAALSDCKDLFFEAVDRFNDSLASLAADKMLVTPAKLDDVKSWLSAAVTDLETCVDGFEGTIGGIDEKFEAAMKNAAELTSNSLAIASGITKILNKLGLKLHRRHLNTDDISPPKWFSMWQRRGMLQESPAPALLQVNVTVAKDGSGNVRSIMEAVAMAPKKSVTPFAIYVKEGVYEENIVVDKSKWNVHVIGDGMYKTIVSGSLNFADGTPTFSTATFAAVGRRFMARDIGFRNTAGPEKHQAVAFRSGSDQSVYYRCSFDAYQDTLYAHSLRQFYRECDIVGTVDFIFGDAVVVFQSCNIRPRQPMPNQQNIITAQGRKDPNQNTGISIQGCNITAFDQLTAPTYLGRPWKNYSTTVFMQTEIGPIVDATGWLPWVPGTAPPETIYYGEYRNSGPGSDLAGRVTWAGYKSMLSDNEAKKFTVGSFLKGEEWIAQAGVTFGSTL